MQEAQDVVAARFEAHEQVVPDAMWFEAAALSTEQPRQVMMEGEPLRHDGVVAALEQRDERRFERAAALAR